MKYRSSSATFGVLVFRPLDTATAVAAAPADVPASIRRSWCDGELSAETRPKVLPISLSSPAGRSAAVLSCTLVYTTTGPHRPVCMLAS